MKLKGDTVAAEGGGFLNTYYENSGNSSAFLIDKIDERDIMM
jgi:hypothetical protein